MRNKITAILFLLVILSAFKGYSQDSTFIKIVFINVPIIDLNSDTLYTSYITQEYKYIDDEEIFTALDSIVYEMYGGENYNIYMVYDNYIDVNNCQYIDISKISVRHRGKKIIKIRVKKKKVLKIEYNQRTSNKAEERKLLFGFIRIG